MNRSTLTQFAVAVFTMLSLVGSGWAQKSPAASAPAMTASAPSSLARDDVAFLKQAAQNGHAEVEGSKLAERKSANEKVKAFAKMMIDDHTKAGTELNALATSKGVDIPSTPSSAQQAKLKQLDAADGAKFDEKYTDELGVKAHQDTIKLFQKAAARAKDAEVKAWAGKTLPTLQQHLDQARELKKAMSAKK